MQTISSQIETFDNPDTCLHFMTNLSNERVLFIASDSVDLCVLATVQSLSVVTAMYMSIEVAKSTQQVDLL